jgi:molybdopterin converting factor small subunit
MRVFVHLGEPFWREVGQRDVTVGLATGATVGQALDVLSMRYPALAWQFDTGEVLPTCFVNEELAGLEARLFEGAVLHVVWPVSGG